MNGLVNKQLKTMASQRGLSGLGMLAVVMLIVGGAFLVIKIAPLYIEDYEIKSAVISLGEEPGLYELSKQSIRNKLRTKLAAGYSGDLGKDEVKIVKKKGLMTIDVVYENRIELVHNIDLVAKFAHQIEYKQNQ